jgi:glucose/mannose transport system permease protein
MRRTRERLLAVALVSPSILAIAIFVYGFIGWSARVSLSAWQGLLPNYAWVGLANYAQLLRDRRFQIDMRNTAIFTGLFLAACLLLGLLLAILLDQRLKGEGLFRSVFLFPMAISFIVTGVAWRWLMNPATGTRLSGLNLLFHNLGLDGLVSAWHTTPPPWGIAFIVLRPCGRCPDSRWRSTWPGSAGSRMSCARRPGWTGRTSCRSSAASCSRCWSRRWSSSRRP